MKNQRSVQVTSEQKGVPHLQGNKPGKAEWGQSNPTHKSTRSYSQAFLQLKEFLPDQGTHAGYGPYSPCEIQLIPPLRGTSENKLITRTREDQCTLSTSVLWPGHSQQRTSPSPLCQTQDALLVQHESEPRVHLSTPVASLPSTAWQVDTTRHNLSLRWTGRLVCFCTTSTDFIYFSPGPINTQNLRETRQALRLCSFNNFWFPMLVGCIAMLCIRKESWHS